MFSTSCKLITYYKSENKATVYLFGKRQVDEYELLGDGSHALVELTLHALPPLQPGCVTLGSYFFPCKLLLRSQKCVCRCIYDLFTFWAYLLDVRGRRGILDKLDTAVCEESDNAAVSLAARKNKTHCMTNTRVIHSQSMEGVGFNGIFHKSHPCQIH